MWGSDECAGVRMTGRNVDALAAKANAEIERGIPGEPEGVGAESLRNEGGPCTQWVSAEKTNLRNLSEAGAHNLLKVITRGRGLESSKSEY